MEIKDKLLRIAVEADLYKIGESDTITTDTSIYRISKSINGWWDLSKTTKASGHTTEISFYGLARLFRHLLNAENIKY